MKKWCVPRTGVSICGWPHHKDYTYRCIGVYVGALLMESHIGLGCMLQGLGVVSLQFLLSRP